MNPPEIVAAGLTHSLLVAPEGHVYQFGDLGSQECFTKPHIVSGLPPIASVAAGSLLSLFVDHDGNAWGMGNSHYGQLGIVDRCVEPHQIQFEGDVKIKMAAASRNYFSVFLDEDGSVWTSGYNGHGQLGLGHFDNATPTKIQNIPKMCSISAGYYHTLLLDENGEVWACGYNVHGQLGRPFEFQKDRLADVAKITAPVRFKAISAGELHSMFLDVEGRVWGCGHNSNASLALPHTRTIANVEEWRENPKIAHISAGSHRSLLVGEDGGVWYAGKKVEEKSVRIFNPQKVSKVREISACARVSSCDSHHLVVDTEGQVWVWGNNKNGQLGLGHKNFVPLPVLNDLSMIQLVQGPKSARKV